MAKLMVETLDQLFVSLKHWAVGLFPDALQPLVAGAISVAADHRGLWHTVRRHHDFRAQRARAHPESLRPQPGRAGWGFCQFLPDGIKALIKEDFVPRAADRVVHFLAPVVFLIPILLAYAVLPVGRNMTAVDFDAGILFFFAVGASTELAVFMAGWSSRNKYSLLGAVRAIAQMISYEIPLILSSVTVIMMVGSLNLGAIVEAQTGYTWILPNWFVLTPWGFAGFILFFMAAMAESNRSPFDLPEAESELVAGYFTEYSGFKFALFFIAEYFGMFAISGLGITLFLGGWNAPLSFLGWVPSYLWFFAKLIALIFLFIWVRGTVPRLRMDQLMNFAWKFMLPMALINILVAAVWHYMGGGWTRWLVCSLLVAGPYVLLGRGLLEQKQISRRTYRFAD